MATVKLIEYAAASPEVRAVYDDIMATRKTDWINNFCKGAGPSSADSQANLGQRQGSDGAGRPRPARVKEMIYIAVSATNGCEYCIRSHTAGARKAGHGTETMLGELIAIVGMANETNRLANSYQVDVDEPFK